MLGIEVGVFWCQKLSNGYLTTTIVEILYKNTPAHFSFLTHLKSTVTPNKRV